jgi:hypothetical protein
MGERKIVPVRIVDPSTGETIREFNVAVTEADQTPLIVPVRVIEAEKPEPQYVSVKAIEPEPKRGPMLDALAQAKRVPLGEIKRVLTENTTYRRTLGMTRAEKAKTAAPETPPEATDRIKGGVHPLYYINRLTSLLDAGLWENGSRNEQKALRKLLLALERVVRADQGDIAGTGDERKSKETIT